MGNWEMGPGSLFWDWLDSPEGKAMCAAVLQIPVVVTGDFRSVATAIQPQRNQPQQPTKDSVLPADGDLKETSKGVGFHDAKHAPKGD